MYKVILGNKMIGTVEHYKKGPILLDSVLYSPQVIDHDRMEICVYRKEEVVEATPYVEPESKE